LALVQVIWNGKERAAHLLVWAGADPHQRAPILEWKQRGSDDDTEEDTHTAVETAVDRGQGKLLRILKPDLQVDDFAQLYANVSDPETVDFLLRIKAPDDWSAAIRYALVPLRLHSTYINSRPPLRPYPSDNAPAQGSRRRPTTRRTRSTSLIMNLEIDAITPPGCTTRCRSRTALIWLTRAPFAGSSTS
jgi:hypothetical protein